MVQLANTTTQFMSETKTNFQNQAAFIRNLEVQVGQFANIMVDRLPGNLPSTTEVNPVEHCKTITLRSGKELVEPEQNKKPTKAVQQTEITPEPSTKIVEDTATPQLPSSLAIPFPQRLQKNKKDKQFSKFIDIFKKLYINTPFINALTQMPQYMKFMKDILQKKRKLEDYEMILLTKECSAILQRKLLPKLKDPGNFFIPCSIGDVVFENALCELGANINLLPLSISRKLGLGEVRPTTVSLQLADRSIKYPRGDH
ncbi:uncharacterized protein LOC111019514 [Momordica charantia]|uniref:Uncharacterized protein LOC111019514 n=1 Tax=Momordica charantia TaxID=3673 RepID=A0A6J1DDY6_MOMCH|nr:uncharacterized protein LOC111019514 [Momordica charantia]